jgi:hypothetical protein
MPVLHPGTGQRRTARRRLHHTKTRHNLSKRALRGCPIEFYLFTNRLCVHVNHNHKLQYTNSGEVILESKAKRQQPRAGCIEVKTAPLTHDMKKVFQNISHTGNFIVYAPPKRERRLFKMLSKFYRTASKTLGSEVKTYVRTARNNA